VLDQNRTLLFRHFERHYLYLRPATPLAEEGLLVPFYVNGKAVGTLWAIAPRVVHHLDARRSLAQQRQDHLAFLSAVAVLRGAPDNSYQGIWTPKSGKSRSQNVS
jgi:hypothetical protein